MYLLMFIREWIKALYGVDALCELSKRFTIAARQLGLRHVPRIFDVKHGSITGLHYRALIQVVAVITHDYIPADSPMGCVIAATVDWYWACRASTFTVADIASLQEKCTTLGEAWAELDTVEWRATLGTVKDKKFPKACVLLTNKFHRALRHCVDYVREWGPMEYITTETSEALHKPLKEFFRT